MISFLEIFITMNRLDPTTEGKSLYELWMELKDELQSIEQNAHTLLLRGDFVTTEQPVIKYHRRSGVNAFLSENFPCTITCNGLVFPSVQHAFQAMKIDPTISNYKEIIENICKGTVKEARALGKSSKMKAALERIDGRLELMFSLCKAKFIQNKDLGLWLLHHTANKPIWHIFDEDTEKIWSKSFTPHESSEKWWESDNWNGKILCVVRHVLRQTISLDPHASTLKADQELQKHCPVPMDFLTQPLNNMHPDTQPLALETVIAGKFQVVRIQRPLVTGSCIGAYCYICDDASPRETREIDTIRECLESSSLKEFRNEISTLIEGLSMSNPQPRWEDMERTLARVQGQRFFDCDPPSWWITLTLTLKVASRLPPLRAAHSLRQLLHNPPLGSKAVRPRVFIKTFNERRRRDDPHGYGRAVILEICRCSAKAPDFGCTSLEAHVNVSAILGGSHAGSLSQSNKHLAFVALEHCDGMGLNLLGSQISSVENMNVVQGLFSQVYKAVQYLHRCGVIHGKVSPENFIVDRRGVVKLIDCGGMYTLEEKNYWMSSFHDYPHFREHFGCHDHVFEVLKSNDIWMMTNVLLFLTLHPWMPRHNSELLFPNDWGENGKEYLTVEMNEVLDKPSHKDLRQIFNLLYSQTTRRSLPQNTMQAVEAWISSAPDPAQLLQHIANCFLDQQEDSSSSSLVWSPDVDLVELAGDRRSHGVVTGSCFTVCRVGSSVQSILDEGDIICTGDQGASCLLGGFNTKVNIRVLRDGVLETVSAPRLRDIREHVLLKTPERFRLFLFQATETNSVLATRCHELWDMSADERLQNLELIFLAWKAQNDSGSLWTFSEVLRDWRCRGLVFKEADTGAYQFLSDCWPQRTFGK